MLFTKLHIQNLYCFQDSTIDFTFPKKPVNSTIADEHPSERPRINVKRFAVFTGANASGKTAIGKIMCGVQNLIARGSGAESIYQAISDVNQPAVIQAEVICTRKNWIYSFKFTFEKNEHSIKGLPTQTAFAAAYITKTDYIASARKKLQAIFDSKQAGPNEAYFECDNFITFRDETAKYTESLLQSGWYYQLAQNTDSSIKEFDTIINKDVLDRVLKTFDASIKKVSKIISSGTRAPLGYKVEFTNSDSVIIENDGDISKEKSERLSRGTYEAIKIALFLSRIINDGKETGVCSTYFLDEAMAYAHSELELSMINLVLDKLCTNSQFFYTTHNMDILGLNVPAHSHYFIKKEKSSSQVIAAETIFKKNDRPLKSIIANDVLGIAPDTSCIEEMLWE